MKKIFTGILFFIFAFTIISAIADVYYHHRLTRKEPEKQKWTGQCDFRVYWSAGYRLINFAFGPAQPKSPEYERELEYYVGHDKTRVYDMSEPRYHFRYFPMAAFFMIPLSMIAYPMDALAIWFIMLNISLLAALLLLTRQIRTDFQISRNVRCMILWGAFIASLKFYLMNIAIGQSDVFIALFFVFFLMAYIRGRDILCGVILALILQFKPQFAIIIPYFLFSGKSKLALSALLGFAAFLFAPAALIGIGKTAVLLKDCKEAMSLSVQSQLLDHKNQSITYFVGKFILGIKALNGLVQADRLFYALSAVLTIAAYIPLLLLKRSLKLEGNKKFKYLEISLLIIITLLFSPQIWVAQFICVIIPVGITVLFLSTSREKARIYAAIAGFFALSVIAGTDITARIPVIKDMHFFSTSLGVICLTYALVNSYKQQDAGGKLRIGAI